MAPTPKTGLAAGLNKGHVVTKRDKKVKPSHSKGVSLQHIRRQLPTTATIFGVRPDFCIFQQSQWLQPDVYILYENSCCCRN